MYIIEGENHNYIMKANGQKPVVVSNIDKATKWELEDKAINILNNECRSAVLMKYGFHVVEIKDDEFGYCPKLLEDVRIMKEKVATINNRKIELQNKLSIADKTINDLMHAIEFYELNACYGYKLYKRLHDICNERREIKNELEEINYFMSSNMCKSSIEKLECNLLKMKHKKYTPRVLQELFTSGE